MIKNKGFTLIEIFIVFFIIGIISSIVFLNLSSFRNDQALRNASFDIVSTLDKARQNTLSSLNSTNYSVHFDSNKIVLFSGSVYSSTNPTNEIINFNPAVIIPEVGGINIGGGSDAIFERLTGDTIGGTIVVQLVSDSARQKIITISKTGVSNSN